MQRIAVASGKGGVGKTTLAVGLASICAGRGLRTLLVDMDPSCNATWSVGGDVGRRDLVDALTGGTWSHQDVRLTLGVLCGGPELGSAEVAALDAEELRDVIGGLAGWDAVVIDTPPGDDRLARLGTVAADAVLVAMDSHPFAASGAGRVIADLASRKEKGRPGASRWAIVQTRVDLRRKADRGIPEVASIAWPDVPIFQVRQDSRLANATAYQDLVAESVPEAANGMADLAAVAAWSLGEAS